MIGSGHIAKMAGMPIYGKNPLKTFKWPWNFEECKRVLSPTKCVWMMTLGWPWSILQKGRIWSLRRLNGKKCKTAFIQNIYGLWNENRSYMNPYECQRSRLFSLRSLGLKVHQNFKYLLLRNQRANSSQTSYRIFMPHGNKSLYNWSWSHDKDGSHANIW